MNATQTLPNDAERSGVAPLLQHIARYRLITFPVLQHSETLAAGGPRKIRQMLRYCEEQALLGSAWLCQGLRYWYIQPQAACQLGLPEQASGPLSEPAKVRAYALLHFCYLSETVRHRLTTAELAEQFPDWARPGLPQGYYYDPSGAGRLGLAKLDITNRGRWDRVVQSVREQISDHMKSTTIRRLVLANRFEITVLTVLPQKAKRLQEALLNCADANRIPVQVIALPELLPLIASLT